MKKGEEELELETMKRFVFKKLNERIKRYEKEEDRKQAFLLRLFRLLSLNLQNSGLKTSVLSPLKLF